MGLPMQFADVSKEMDEEKRDAKGKKITILGNNVREKQKKLPQAAFLVAEHFPNWKCEMQMEF